MIVLFHVPVPAEGVRGRVLLRDVVSFCDSDLVVEKRMVPVPVSRRVFDGVEALVRVLVVPDSVDVPLIVSKGVMDELMDDDLEKDPLNVGVRVEALVTVFLELLGELVAD